jgi:hypothetical protein
MSICGAIIRRGRHYIENCKFQASNSCKFKECGIHCFGRKCGSEKHATNRKGVMRVKRAEFLTLSKIERRIKIQRYVRVMSVLCVKLLPKCIAQMVNGYDNNMKYIKIYDWYHDWGRKSRQPKVLSADT